ncbi:MAG TPA: hypothetical protein VGV88_02755 [Candidatus Dormibacteraeota bacterium]|nr:hypothetical protein [Candidatus Dormibacteraeota bacterium]
MDDQLLSQRFHAALDVEPRAGAVERFRSEVSSLEAPRRFVPWPNVELRAGSRRLVATALIIMLALAAFGAFLALRQYVQNNVPANRAGSSVTCVAGLHMVTDKIGWQTPWSRTTDGGVTWSDTHVPSPPYATIGPGAGCTLDSVHAWVIEPAGAFTVAPQTLGSETLHVFATSDGGASWSERGEVPTGSTTLLAFIDTERGWLLTDNGYNTSPSRARDLYTTADGGYHWTRLASAFWSDPGAFGHTARGCVETSLTFVSASRGWLSWDCFQAGQEQLLPYVSVLALTNDGGRTWSSVDLPSMAGEPDAICAASAPVIVKQSGLLAVSCFAGPDRSFARLYRTTDGGTTWTVGPELPRAERVGGIDIVDTETALAFLGSGPASHPQSDLYRSDGQSWTLVKADVFPGGRFVYTVNQSFQFVDALRGFTFVSTAENVGDSSDLFTTTNGGTTWTPVGQQLS